MINLTKLSFSRGKDRFCAWRRRRRTIFDPNRSLGQANAHTARPEMTSGRNRHKVADFMINLTKLSFSMGKDSFCAWRRRRRTIFDPNHSLGQATARPT